MKKLLFLLSLLVLLISSSVSAQNETPEPTAAPVGFLEMLFQNKVIPELMMSQSGSTSDASAQVPTPVPDPFADVAIQQGSVYRSYPCGNDFSFMIIYQPVMSRSLSSQTAFGTFIYFRVQITNLTGRTLSGLKYESFTLTNDKTGITYPLSPVMSTATSILWDLNLLRNDIFAGGLVDTYLAFDVQGAYNDPWILNILPTEKHSDEQFTPIRISLPKISQQ